MNIVDIIQTMGFPIACVIALGWYAYNTTNRIMDLTEKVTNALTTVSGKMEELSDTIKEMIRKGDDNV